MHILVKIAFIDHIQHAHQRLLIEQNSAQNTLLHFHTLGRELLEDIGLQGHRRSSLLFSRHGHLYFRRHIARQTHRYDKLT